MKKTHVAVLMGGTSAEHEVSINSGQVVLAGLDTSKYKVTPIIITKDGRWTFDAEAPVSIFTAIPLLKALGVDCAFIALHGVFGEDGRIQGMLDMLGIPYTSSGHAASALAMDKIRCKAVVRELNIRVAKHFVVQHDVWKADPDLVTDQVEKEIGFSCVVKSPCQGSSLGLRISATRADFLLDMEHVFEFGTEVMIEEFIPGLELTCGVLDIDSRVSARGLPVTQIMPVTSSFFDYEAKYQPGATEEITPAEISADLTAKVQEIAVRVHQVVGCKIWSRSDFILAGSDPVWIEINTVPGMTQTSLYPQAAAVAGISFSELVGLFVEAAINEAQHKS